MHIGAAVKIWQYSMFDVGTWVVGEGKVEIDTSAKVFITMLAE